MSLPRPMNGQTVDTTDEDCTKSVPCDGNERIADGRSFGKCSR